MKLLGVLVGLFLLWPTLALADPDPGTLDPEVNDTGADNGPRGIMWNLQAGVFMRLGGNRYRESSGSVMGTLDLSWLKWDRKQWTWGLGIHGAFSDDGGPRFAPRALYRIPLDKPGSFFQASGGVYVAAIDQEMNNLGQNTTRLNLPGCFLEAEYGYNDWFSLVFGAEALPLDIYAPGEYSTDMATPVDNTTITNFWFGAKGGQVIGLGAIIVAGILVGLWAASF